ncbi:MAG: FHA domain-containing protein [Roseimicrobium sp.]
MSTENDPVIRITKDDANSRHVDDLLKRQMSLRGETGIARDRSKSIFLQNWLVLMVVGCASAIAAWAIIEPWFDDRPLITGTVESVEVRDDVAKYTMGMQTVDTKVPTVAKVVVNGQNVWLAMGVREVKEGKPVGWLNPALISVGDKVGVYIEQTLMPSGGDSGVATFVERLPAEAVLGPQKTIAQLASQSSAISLLFFPIVAACIGLGIGSVDGIVCRLPRRALLCGLVGLVVGFVGGFVTGIIANIAYAPITTYAGEKMAAGGAMAGVGFGLQMMGRMLAWGLAGMVAGVGQGLALRSTRLATYGFVGGVVGGLLGGMFFDPIDTMLLGEDKLGADVSRLVGIAMIGACVGAMIGVVELLARDAWLRMIHGPLKGKEFLLFKDVMNIGSSPKSDLYLFNDTRVAPQHALIRTVGEGYEIEARQSTHPVIINGSSLQRSRLRHGDEITIGGTVFTFQTRKS